MKYQYYKSAKNNLYIDEYFELSFPKKVTPLKTRVLPNTLTSITYINKGSLIVSNTKNKILKGLILSGQFSKSYNLYINEETEFCGITMHPTFLYKLLGVNISVFLNSHKSFKNVSKKNYNLIKSILSNKKKGNDVLVELENVLNKTPLTINDSTKNIDKSIDFIRKKEGILQVTELLSLLNISQKTLENHFKKIIGLTPGKYINLYKFTNLIRKYENQEIDIKDLIYIYDYYDHSHFSRDFKLFMNETPKLYFKKDYPILIKHQKK